MAAADITTKKCSRCLIEKPVTEFYKSSSCPPYQSRCKECCKKSASEWTRANPERTKAKNKKWQSENEELAAELRKRWYEQNKDYKRAYSIKRRKENPEKYATYVRNARKKEHVGEAHRRRERERYQTDKDRIKQRIKEFKAQNPAYVNEINAARKARKKQAIPKWANKAYIKLWYQIAVLEKERTGKDCHIDHIVPLISPLVCGLHCEDNLQVLLAEQNASKSNRHWPNMP